MRAYRDGYSDETLLDILKGCRKYGVTKLVIENNLHWFSKLKGLKYASLGYFNAAGYDLNQRIKC